MVVPLHLGFEHPNLVWIAITALLAFIAGMGVNLYRSSTTDHPPDSEESPDR